jgi:hypothetical protein
VRWNYLGYNQAFARTRGRNVAARNSHANTAIVLSLIAALLSFTVAGVAFLRNEQVKTICILLGFIMLIIFLAATTARKSGK